LAIKSELEASKTDEEQAADQIKDSERNALILAAARELPTTTAADSTFFFAGAGGRGGGRSHCWR